MAVLLRGRDCLGLRLRLQESLLAMESLAQHLDEARRKHEAMEVTMKLAVSLKGMPKSFGLLQVLRLGPSD